MADEIIRSKETEAICELVSLASLERTRKAGEAVGANGGALSILDVGCGNGFTLQELQARFPAHKYMGIEQNASLRSIAATRAEVRAGDIRDISSVSCGDGSFDVVVCQRVIINIMDAEDQKRALSNIISLAKPGAALFFIETFRSGLDRLNAARDEFGLGPIPPAIHNLPLPDDFFSCPDLVPFGVNNALLQSNALSTHFFVTRVLHEIALKAMNASFVRNSHFVKFMSAALPGGVGDYSPLRFQVFTKKV
ncbi:MAG: trans-aconitate 2-methyltransferase [Afipia sp.]